MRLSSIGAEVGKLSPEDLFDSLAAAFSAISAPEVEEKAISPKDEIMAKGRPEDEELGRMFDAALSGNKKKTEDLVKDALESGADALKIVEGGLLPAANTVGKLYDDGYVYVPEVLLTSDAMNAGIELCKSRMPEVEAKGSIIMHIADGDIHEIGKNIAKAVLIAKGYKVIDLGRSIPPSVVIEAVKKFKPNVVSGTALMSTTRNAFKKIGPMLEKEGIDIPFIVAGGSVDKNFAEMIPYGIYGKVPQTGIDVLESAIQGKSWKEIRKEIHSR
nr:MtsB [uncultured archaeon]